VRGAFIILFFSPVQQDDDQYRIDHLNGTLYVDRMNTRSFTTVENFNRFWKAKPVAEVNLSLR
jgi:hypothetical protein